jgi:hypothetical protein
VGYKEAICEWDRVKGIASQCGYVGRLLSEAESKEAEAALSEKVAGPPAIPFCKFEFTFDAIPSEKMFDKDRTWMIENVETSLANAAKKLTDKVASVYGIVPTVIPKIRVDFRKSLLTQDYAGILTVYLAMIRHTRTVTHFGRNSEK